ncbi:ATP-binding protein [Shivajiella indica]|uniref:ATP-binding protein n=1 Tax=Shivajiella indica TaxID=872115 RepID=A0ABW5B860_9BACT
MERLFQYSNQLISQVGTAFKRYAHSDINWQNRLIGLIGPRGVGKTTLVLQYIKENLDISQSLYVTSEDFYFATNSLIDLADSFVKNGGKNLFIDEIHKYPNWSRELKLIYDYHKDLRIVFTGSSVLDIKKGSSDLSRRAVVYTMQGLSFREYLELFHQIYLPKFSLQDILNLQVRLPQLPHPLPLFKKYLLNGYYPFAIEDDFEIRLQQVVNQTLENDIPSFAGMHVATGRKLIKLMGIIAQSVPFKPNMTKIAEMLQISRNNVADYLLYMEDAGMIAQLRHQTEGIRLLGKVEKVYLDNTNLINVLANENKNTGNIRETFFINQVRVKHRVTSSTIADFRIDDIDFEIGGKQKGQRQINQTPKGYVVKDDIETSYQNTIPLWHFGLLY